MKKNNYQLKFETIDEEHTNSSRFGPSSLAKHHK